MRQKDEEYRNRIKELQRKYNEELEMRHKELARKEKDYLAETNDLRRQLVDLAKKHQVEIKSLNERYYASL